MKWDGYFLRVTIIEERENRDMRKSGTRTDSRKSYRVPIFPFVSLVFPVWVSLFCKLKIVSQTDSHLVTIFKVSAQGSPEFKIKLPQAQILIGQSQANLPQSIYSSLAV